jgi:tetratricopeptide (TPR) repeat protein/transcriptional regulator with XRE-family HTH domain
MDASGWTVAEGGGHFGQVVVDHRERLGLTQEALAAMTGLSARRIAELESGRVGRPRRSTVALLADAFGLSAAGRERFMRQAYESGDPASAPASPRPSRNVPRQLPAPPPLFTGRVMELADLDKVHDASTVVIIAIDGMAGVGKTALAVQAAHQMVERYPDGQLFIDLQGYTDGVASVGPGEALDRMLRALGVPGGQVPTGLDERAGLYRSRLADQRMVILLDNAATEAQVVPLLPGSPGCVVLVTSRRRLAGLDHTHVLSLDTLPTPDAVALFRQSVSDSRLAGQPPDLVVELVELCGRLPLAIRIAAARLRSHPAWDLSHLTARLRDKRHRLVELEAGQRSIAAALDLSYQDLRTALRRAYRLLGLHPGPDIDAYAAAALLEDTLREAGRLLERLLEAHLLEELTAGRYRFHDLTRAHAARTATRDETVDGRRKAVDRLLDYYRHTAGVAMDAAYPYERERRPQVPPSGTASPALSDPATALDWLDRELPNLVAAVEFAAGHDRPAHLLHLSTILHRHLRTRGLYHTAVSIQERALTTAHATGDHAAELNTLTVLGFIHLRQSRFEQATDRYQQALRLARATGRQAAEMDALIGLGHIDRARGRHERAIDNCQQALRLARAAGHRPGELAALLVLGHLHRRQGQHEQAAEDLGQAVRLARTAGHGINEPAALTCLGIVHRMQGRYEQAADYYQRLLDLAHETGDRNWQFEAWQGLGRVRHATGHPDDAISHHEQALALAIELGHPDGEARAHDGLARANVALHQDERARAHWRHALDILTRLGIDNAADEETTVAAIRDQLANVDHETAAPKK